MRHSWSATCFSGALNWFCIDFCVGLQLRRTHFHDFMLDVHSRLQVPLPPLSPPNTHIPLMGPPSLGRGFMCN